MEQKWQKYLMHVSVSLLQGSPGGALKRQSLRVIYFWSWKESYVLCSTSINRLVQGDGKNRKGLCSPLHYVQQERTVPAKPLSEDWADIWAEYQGRQEHLPAACDHLQLKHFIYVKHRSSLYIIVDTWAEDAGTLGPKFISFHSNCPCACSMVCCCVVTWRGETTTFTWGLTHKSWCVAIFRANISKYSCFLKLLLPSS